MSFLGYIGKTLGAGTAPIYNANLASQSDIQYREFRDKAPNRAEEEAMRMAGLRRTEQTEIDAEAERQRIMREGQGRLTTGYTPPGGALGTGAALPEGAGEKIELPPARRTAPAGLNATGASAAPAVVAGTPGTDPTAQPASTPGVSPIDETTLARLNSLGGQIDKYTARLAEIKDERAKLNRRNLIDPTFPIREYTNKKAALNQEEKTLSAAITGIQNEEARLKTSQAATPAAGLTGAPAATPAAAAAATPPAAVTATAAATPAAAAAPPATATAAQPTPAQPAPVSYPQSVAEIDPERDFEIYQIEPGRLSYDMTLVTSEYDRYVQRIQDAYRFTDMSDPKNVQATFLAVQPLEDALIQLDGQYAKLEVSQGIGMAMGGDTRYINSVMTAALGYPLEVEPRLNTDGSIGYGVSINNVPMGDGELLTPEQMRVSLMRMVDTQLDLELTQQELSRSAEIAKMYAEAQIKGELMEMEISGKLQQEIYSQALQGGREQALELLRQAAPSAKELSVMADGTIVFTDQTGTLFSLVTEEKKIDGKRRQFPVTQPITRRP